MFQQIRRRSDHRLRETPSFADISCGAWRNSVLMGTNQFTGAFRFRMNVDGHLIRFIRRRWRRSFVVKGIAWLISSQVSPLVFSVFYRALSHASDFPSNSLILRNHPCSFEMSDSRFLYLEREDEIDEILKRSCGNQAENISLMHCKFIDGSTVFSIRIHWISLKFDPEY